MESIVVLVLLLFSCSTFTSTEAYDPLDPTGNITLKWDVMSWTADGYVAIVTMYNFQQYRHIQEPGWTLGWTWAKKEVIWNMMGSQTTEQGDCSKFKAGTPHCCKKDPTVVDMLPGTPYNQQIANCCKGGVLNSWAQDPSNAVSSFQLSVGSAGTTNKTVKLPRNFTLRAPGPGYTCGPAKIVRPTQFITSDKRRVTQALMTWNITCTYSQFLAQKTPTCCVSLSSFYNDTVSRLSTFIFNSIIIGETCKYTSSPIMNYSQWNLVVQHPNFDNLTQLFSFKYKSLNPYEGLNDTGMLWGVKFYNDFLSSAGAFGNVQSEILFRKDKSTFTFDKGWAFPRRIYFNGDNCVMPPPDAYPWSPNASSNLVFSLLNGVNLNVRNAQEAANEAIKRDAGG
ncbi:hypothetical protein TSUD_274620 [Trifolium subterraneum]|uniref:COBRA C-terminal domain-containing protein n=1 Tax=Trifolium subterraneum TaxID=3900 RepID=A0A2Z6N279_TRISU|nr:hypothetical protein TSUD_274620 [Trifolium subterraneum]